MSAPGRKSTVRIESTPELCESLTEMLDETRRSQARAKVTLDTWTSERDRAQEQVDALTVALASLEARERILDAALRSLQGARRSQPTS